MAIKDLKTTVQLSLNETNAIGANGTTVGADFDTAEFLSVTFGLSSTAYTDGTHTLALQESDDDVTYTTVPAAKLIGSLPAITSVTAALEVIETVGVFSNMRYIRPSIVSTGVTTGATVQILQIAGFERMASDA